MKAVKAVSLAFILALPLAAGACGGGGGNRLLGTWRLSEGASCTLDRVTFTAGNVINHSGPQSYYAGRESTVGVIYRVDGPDRVNVTTRDQASSETYILNDDNHMTFGSQPDCRFERA